MTDDGFIVLRTSNKKYYKRFQVQDLTRLGCKDSLEPERLTMAHANNTLIIEYPKPQAVLAFERALKAEWDSLKATEEGQVDCNQS